jgi:prolyl oligopeptidase
MKAHRHSPRARFFCATLFSLMLAGGVTRADLASSVAPRTLPAVIYPATRTVDTSDTYFGTTYKDPYRWLENLKDPEVAAWFKAQAVLTDAQLAKIPGRDALAEEWMALDKLKPAAYQSIDYENGRIFYKKTLGGENVGRLFFRDGWNGAEKLLFDPSTYKADGKTTINSFAPSLDGHHVALGLTAGGAEFSEIRILDVDHGTLLPESFYPSYGPGGWTLDSKSFFYDAGKVTDLKSLEIELHRKTRLHQLGTDFAADPDFFSDESNPELGIAPKEFPSAGIDDSYPDYIIGSVGTVQNEMRTYYAPASEMKHAPIKWDVLCQTSDNLVVGMEFAGDFVYAVTHTNAPRYKLVRTNVKHPDWKNAETILPEAPDSIQSITKTKDFLLVVYSNGILCRLPGPFIFATPIGGRTGALSILLPGPPRRFSTITTRRRTLLRKASLTQMSRIPASKIWWRRKSRSRVMMGSWFRFRSST